MAKPTKKQQRHALKKQKARAEKRRGLRNLAVRQADSPPYDFEPVLRTGPQDDEAMLRDAIQQFVFQDEKAPEMETALALYFGEEFRRTRILTADEPEIATFQEWYFFDYMPRRGVRLIEQFAEEVGPTLPPTQQAMLNSWIETNRLRLFEVREVTPGVGEVVEDLLTGEVIRAGDITMSLTARKWATVLARSLRTGDRWGFTGSGIFFSPEDKPRLVRFLNERWQHYQASHPDAVVADFYRDHSLELFKYAQKVRDDAAHPLYLSAEGHELVRSSATYRVLDYPRLIEVLDESEEFVFAGQSEEMRNAEHYNWVLRGRSQAPNLIKPESERRAILFRTEWSAGAGNPSFLNLGDLYVGPKLLRLDCLSRERLVLGRRLLEEILAGLIAHTQDTFTAYDLQPATLASRRPQRSLSKTDPNARQFELEFLEREAQTWLNTPIPSLDNRSPLEAVQQPEGRARVEEMLKGVEYHQEYASSLKNTALDVRNLRKALGLAS